VLASPLHAERVHPGHHDVRALECRRDFLQLIRGDFLWQLQVQAGMASRLLDRVDDVAVEMGTDEMDLVAVVAERSRQGGSHNPGAECGDHRDDVPL
jgi:hypothetical protein